MILLLLIGCGLVLLNCCTVAIACLVLVKFGLVISLPGGLVVQEMSASSQSSFFFAVIADAIVSNIIVNSVQILCFMKS